MEDIHGVAFLRFLLHEVPWHDDLRAIIELHRWLYQRMKR